MSANRSKLVTYSRAKRKLVDSDACTKRKRVSVVEVQSDEEDDERNTRGSVVASSPPSERLPSETAIFSDGVAPISTPPSSPPLLPPSSPPFLGLGNSVEPCGRSPQGLGPEATSDDPRVEAKHRNAFSMLRRQLINKPKKKPLVQMQLNLGQTFQKRCKLCAMEYIPSNPEDSALHRKYHQKKVDGVYISRDFLRKAEGWGGIEWHGKDGEARIVSISRHRRCQTGRQYIAPVLDVVQAELGAVDIAYDLLWSLCYTKLPSPGRTSAQDEEVRGETIHGPCYERYKVYLYTHGTKCVGLCLVERINKAYKVLGPEHTTIKPTSTDEEDGVQPQQEQEVNVDMDSPVAVAETADDAWMGVSRIWVSSSFRKKGVASALLDCASKTFRDKIPTPKEMIAFSQPTQSGARLARRWFGRQYGWHVYKDCNVTIESDKGDFYSRRQDEMPKA